MRIYADPTQTITPFGIDEDALGNLWIADRDQVFRFDGAHFDAIPAKVRLPAGIATLPGGNLLITGDEGVYLYGGGKTQRLLSGKFTRILKAAGGRLLFLEGPWRPDSEAHGVVTALWEGGRLSVVSQNNPIPFPTRRGTGSLLFACRTGICQVKDDSGLLDAARRGGILEFAEKSLGRIAVKNGATDGVMVAMGGDGGILLLSPYSGELSLQRKGRLESVHVGRSRFLATPIEDKQGRVWIPGDSLWVLEHGSLQRFSAPELQTATVVNIYEDARGRVWFGLKEAGLAVFGQEPVVETWPTPAAYGEINALAQGAGDTYYAATYKGEFYRKRGGKNWEQVPRGANAPPIGQVVWSGGKLFGLVRLGPVVELSTDGRVLRQVPLPEGFDASSMKRLVVDVDGSILAGVQRNAPGGLMRIRENRMTAVSLPSIGENIGGQCQDIVWVAGLGSFGAYEGGVCRIGERECKPWIGKSDGLLSVKIRSTAVVSEGEVWVAYRDEDAFSRLLWRGGRWEIRHFRESSGYVEPRCTFLKKDSRGWIWRGSGAGVWISDGRHVEPGDWIHLGVKEGLPADPVGRFGFLEDADHSIWLGTAAGIAHVVPDLNWFAAQEKPMLSAVQYEGQWSTGAFPARFPSLRPLRVRVGARGLLPLEYRCVPAQILWGLAPPGGEIVMDHLQKGNYRLEVRAGTTGQVAAYSFEMGDVEGTRRELSVAGGLGLVGLVSWGWVRRVRRRRRELEAKILPDLGGFRQQAMSPQEGALAGAVLEGRFVVERRIARGGFADVYLGWDKVLELRCAVKVFHEALGYEERWLRRFQQEVAALESVSHPNIVQIFGHGSTPEVRAFLVMEFVEGGTLRELIHAGPVPRAYAAVLLRQCGSALAALHEKRVFHRDLKPENLMLRRGAPSGQELVLLDFSIAVVKPDGVTAALTQPAGTFGYMAPEQIMGHAEAATDIYSLAAVTLELLTGQHLAEVLPNAAFELPERVKTLALKLGFSEGTAALVGSALEFDPARRPKDAAAFAAEIAEDLERQVL